MASMNAAKLLTNPKMLMGVVLTTVVALVVINTISKRVPAFAKFVEGF